jgi:hypothetical protein
MARRVLTTMSSTTAVAAVVGGCLLLGPAPQALAASPKYCDPKNGNCVTLNNGGGFTVKRRTEAPEPSTGIRSA